jgi:hypothetical protein
MLAAVCTWTGVFDARFMNFLSIEATRFSPKPDAVPKDPSFV